MKIKSNGLKTRRVKILIEIDESILAQIEQVRNAPANPCDRDLFLGGFTEWGFKTSMAMTQWLKEHTQETQT